MKKKRDKFVDIARAFAIILVVLCHASNFNNPFLVRFINLFFIPLFIFISGYVYNIEEIKSFGELFNIILKKTKKLYIFYFKYEVIYLVLTNLFFKIGFYSYSISYGNRNIYPLDSFGTFLKKFFQICIGMGRELFCGAFWFIITLIFIIIAFSILLFIKNKIKNLFFKKWFLTFSTFSLFFIGCVMNKTFSIPRFSPACTLLVFYYLGFVCKKNNVKWNSKFIAIFSFISLIMLQGISYVNLVSNTFTSGILLFIGACLGIYFIMFISLYMSKLKYVSNVLIYIGQNTMPIIGLHFLCFKIPLIIQYLVGDISYDKIAYLNGYNNNNLWYVLYVICGIGIPLLLNYLVSKFKLRGRVLDEKN